MYFCGEIIKLIPMKHTITRDNALEMQRKSAEKRKKNNELKKSAREVLRQLLYEEESNGRSRLENLTRRCIDNAMKGDITLQDLKTIQMILGEYTKNVSIDARKPEDVVKDFMDRIN